MLIGCFPLPGLGNFPVMRDEPWHSDIVVMFVGSVPVLMLGEFFEGGHVDETGGYDLAVKQEAEIPHDIDIVSCMFFWFLKPNQL